MTDRASNKMYEVRKELHLTQSQAGMMIGISARMYSYYETGTKLPNVFTALNIATAFGVSVERLFGEYTDYVKTPPKRKDPYEWREAVLPSLH